jgi:hypothetical protein
MHESSVPGTFGYALDHRVPYFDIGYLLGLSPALVIGWGYALYKRIRRR